MTTDPYPMFRYMNSQCAAYPHGLARYPYHDAVMMPNRKTPVCMYCVKPVEYSGRTNQSGRYIYEAPYIITEVPW